jgi:hypothetical protein
MTDNRQGNGRFGPGNAANPNGRPKKSRSINATIMRELNAPIMITENHKRHRVTKLAASAKQIANMGASGELRAAKLTMDLARLAESERDASPQPQMLGANDREIVARFVERLRATLIEEAGDAAPQS